MKGLGEESTYWRSRIWLTALKTEDGIYQQLTEKGMPFENQPQLENSLRQPLIAPFLPGISPLHLELQHPSHTLYISLHLMKSSLAEFGG